MSFSAAALQTVLEASVPVEASGLVVALSGGPDSAALLGAAAALGKNFRALPLRAVHIDHGLQAAAVEFREGCKRLCDHLGIPLRIIAVEVQREFAASIEAAARDARYAAIEAEMRPRECLLTAHHREDQAETLLLQALRGAGVKGMSAMPICRPFGRGWHVRPLLDVAHSELRRFGAHLAGSIDPMNEDLRFDRVYLRSMVWPPIEKRWPGAAIALSRAARHMAEAQQLLEMAAGAEVLEAPPTARLLEALRQIFDAEADHHPAIVWGSNALRRYRQRLFFTDADPPRLPDAKPWVGALGTPLELGPRLGNLTWIAQRGGIDAQRLPASLIVRRREGGETLRPARLAKTQTVQHLCQSLGVLPWMRDALPLVFAGNELIAVADLWLDAGWCAAADAPGLKVAWNNAPLVT